jgi:hypothetical protein
MIHHLERVNEFQVYLDKNGGGDGYYLFNEFGKRSISPALDDGRGLRRGLWWFNTSRFEGFHIFLREEDAASWRMRRGKHDLMLEGVRFKQVLKTGYLENKAIVVARGIYIFRKDSNFFIDILQLFPSWNPYTSKEP